MRFKNLLEEVFQLLKYLINKFLTERIENMTIFLKIGENKLNEISTFVLIFKIQIKKFGLICPFYFTACFVLF